MSFRYDDYLNPDDLDHLPTFYEPNLRASAHAPAHFAVRNTFPAQS